MSLVQSPTFWGHLISASGFKGHYILKYENLNYFTDVSWRYSLTAKSATSRIPTI